MKKKSLVFLGFLLTPLFAFAAFDDVTLTTDVTITIASTDLTVSGSSAEVESIVINDDGTFTVTLQSSSALTIASADRKLLGSEASGAVTATRTCTASQSTLALSGASGITVKVSIGNDCDATTTTSTGGGGGGGAPGSVSTGGGGGGGSGVTLVTPATPAVPTEAPAVPSSAAQPSPVAQLVSPAFNRTLTPGMTHADVKRLQQLLNSDPDTRIAASGVGAPGSETTYFGALTEKAVQKFQEKHGVAGVGAPGYGYVGPATRAKLLAIFGEGASMSPGATETTPASPSSATAAQEAALQAQLDALNAQVNELIKQLEAAQ